MQLLRAYLQLVVDPDRLSGGQLKQLINRPNRYVRTATVEAAAQSPRPWRALKAGAQTTDERGVRWLVDTATRLAAATTRDSRPSEVVEVVVREFGLDDFWGDKQTGRADDAEPLAMLSVVRILAEKAPGLGAFLEVFDRRADDEQEKIDQAQDTLGREEEPRQDRVVISTIHAAKGREYDAVVVLDFDPGMSRSSPLQSEEERRVFYVALTRARRRLLVTIDGSRPLHPFVREAIARAESGEVEVLHARLDEILERERDLAVEVARLDDELLAVGDGRLACELDAGRGRAVTASEDGDRALKAAQDAHDAARSDASAVCELLSQARFLARKRPLRRELRAAEAVEAQSRDVLTDAEARAEAARRALQLAERDAIVVRTEPELFSRPIGEALRDVAARRGVVTESRHRSDGRLRELELIDQTQLEELMSAVDTRLARSSPHRGRNAPKRPSTR